MLHAVARLTPAHRNALRAVLALAAIILAALTGHSALGWDQWP
jgi:hypothetical protein